MVESPVETSRKLDGSATVGCSMNQKVSGTAHWLPFASMAKILASSVSSAVMSKFCHVATSSFTVIRSA